MSADAEIPAAVVTHDHGTSDSTPCTQPGDARLLGMWRLLRCEPPLEIEPGTAMCFRPPDLLEYLIPAADTTLSLMLRWRITGNELRTEHPDGSNPMRVDVALTGEGVLTFDFGGPRAWFVRAI